METTERLKEPVVVRPVVTIGGLPGSGTTTAAKLLSSTIVLPWVNGGMIFREMADEMEMELNEFGLYAEAHPDVDRQLDNRLVERMGDGGVILESRLAGANASAKGIQSLRVWLHAPLEVRVSRIRDREGGDLEVLRNEVRERERSERARYLEYYDLDYEDLDHYSLVINSHEFLPDAIVAIIQQTLEAGSQATP